MNKIITLSLKFVEKVKQNVPEEKCRKIQNNFPKPSSKKNLRYQTINITMEKNVYIMTEIPNKLCNNY